MNDEKKENLFYKSEDHICYVCSKEIYKIDWSMVAFIDGSCENIHNACIEKLKKITKIYSFIHPFTSNRFYIA